MHKLLKHRLVEATFEYNRVFTQHTTDITTISLNHLFNQHYVMRDKGYLS